MHFLFLNFVLYCDVINVCGYKLFLDLVKSVSKIVNSWLMILLIQKNVFQDILMKS